MSETIELSALDKRRRPPAPPPPPPEWWDTWLEHPLSDEQFFEVYTAHLLATTPDRDIMRIRTRLWSFVKNFMRLQYQTALAAYRQDHPL